MADSKKGIPIANVKNLNQLSDSSTGSWERGRTSANARSPPNTNAVLSDAQARMGGLSLAAGASDKPVVPGQSAASASAQSASRPTALYPRKPLEGYGFRPTSGASTPTGGLRSPPSGVPPEEAEADAGFNEQVRLALQPQPEAEAEATGDEVPAGIADQDGLGWPGETIRILPNLS